MAHDLHLYWRGPLSSCNYDCPYCPFAKRQSSRAELAADEAALARFVAWCADHRGHGQRLSLAFTPWGEAMIRPHYQAALIELSRLEWVAAVAIQTNLSGRLEWIADADPRRLALWTTYHPGEVALDDFLARCARLDAAGLRYSVGVVGLREHFDHIDELRARLAAGVYLWINAYKSSGPGYYRPGEAERLSAIDPLFDLNALRHPSSGQACAAGSRSLFVDGHGDVRRCHFVDSVRGNLYRDPLPALLGEQPCPQSSCGCFIGYVHLERLGLRQRFGDGLAARLPNWDPSSTTSAAASPTTGP
ncbi:radical SAM protein [Pseudenhygromyxa sp. WMMC2535]|uniref:STM4011 family radical SAM protein n=1 Tax=Pseudenhygromyxa sp. WMMC2535 TaxID=2712867 RepID=UPI00155629CE|nr:STM4011 family radical SAM protein [Pseudenhygromyxa sp. WMMC2535]NVB41094.1 radical SAM protein [Pseudenhygromyxa sp. WMMC2535]